MASVRYDSEIIFRAGLRSCAIFFTHCRDNIRIQPKVYVHIPQEIFSKAKVALRRAGIVALVMFAVAATLAALYLLICFVAVPHAGKWAAEKYGSQALGHAVRVQSIWFNPFKWRAGVKGFSISGSDAKPLVSFDKLTVKIDGKRLFKRIYLVKSVKLDGLDVDMVLLPGGQLNVMSLVPPQKTPVAQPAVAKPAPASAPAVPQKPAPLPTVTVDTIQIKNMRLSFTDQTVTPQFRTVLGRSKLTVTGISTEKDCVVYAKLTAKLDDNGRISVEAQCAPYAKPLSIETAFGLCDALLPVVSPYTGKYVGRTVRAGKLDVRMDYRIDNDILTADHAFLLQHFAFGDKVKSKDALNVPVDLAVALLEDKNERISINLPVTGNLKDPKFAYWPLVGKVLRSFTAKIVASPFSFLSSNTSTDDLRFVRFEPGKAVLSDKEKTRLTKLLKNLADRPKLRLIVNGTYDKTADWDVLRKEMFERSFAQTKAQTRMADEYVLSMLYRAHFGTMNAWRSLRGFRLKGNEAVQAEMRRRLIEDVPADPKSMTALAAHRAQVVRDFVTAQGFDAARTSIGEIKMTQRTMGSVPLELMLRVYEKKHCSGK